MKKIYSESVFMDSGAHGLYNLHVLKLDKESRRSKNEDYQRRRGSDVLDKPVVRWSQGDFSTYYDLSLGTEFRRYCDRYARFMQQMEGRGVLLANVDAISNPEKTWEIQKWFEKTHGVQPVPVIHYGTPLKWVDRYLEAGRYDLLGVGGLGQGVLRKDYFGWGDQFFCHICPESNRRLPLIKTHGFAMTSWEMICRWPWWSVDSATWVKLSAYGWIYVPKRKEKKNDREKDQWRFDLPPMMINFSTRPPKAKDSSEAGPELSSFLPEGREPAPREMEWQKHLNNLLPGARETALAWIKHLGLEIGSLDAQGEMEVFGVSSHHRARSIANLCYLKELEESRPEWPYPLDHTVVERHAVKHYQGFGL